MRVRRRFSVQFLFALLAAALLAPGDLSPRAGAQGASPPQLSQQQQTRERRAVEQPAPQATPQTNATPPASPTPATADDDEVLSVETSLVNVLFNAVDRDRRFVTTLRQEDVRVFENDVPQTVSLFQRETELPLSVAFLVDVSGSQETTLPDEQDAAREFIEASLRPGKDHAAVISFTGVATLEQDLTRDHKLLRDAISRLQVVPPSTREEEKEYKEGEKAEVVPPQFEEYGLKGSTALWDAVWATSNDLMTQTPRQTRRAMILFTDGGDTNSRIEREAAATAAIKADTIIYAIGIEPDCPGHQSDCWLNKKDLRRLSEQTGGRAFFPEDEQQLRAAFAEINQELRTQYLVAYSPTNKARDNTYRRIRIEISNPKLRDLKIKLTYREGYFAAPPRAAAPKPVRAPQERLKRPPRRPKK